MDNQILKTINQMVTQQGGVAEWTNAQSLEVLLPQKIASALKVGELVTFTTSADTNGSSSYFVTYNSDILSRFEELLENSGYVASYGIKYDGYLKQSGFEKLVTDTLCPQNGLIRVHSAVPAITPYVLLNVNYTAEAIEKRLGMVSFWVNGITGVTGVELGDALLWTVDRTATPPIDEQTNTNFEQLLQIGSQHSERLIERELLPWRQKNQRQLQRDEQRVTEYYQDIVAEIKAKMKKKKLEGEEKEREQKRIEATKLELKHKLKDLHERARLEVTAQLHSALIVWLQTVHINCQLIRKKQKSEVVAVWNPYHKQVEPLRCSVSNHPVTSFYLTDESAQIVCPTLWSS
jgi:ribosomal protein L36